MTDIHSENNADEIVEAARAALIAKLICILRNFINKSDFRVANKSWIP